MVKYGSMRWVLGSVDCVVTDAITIAVCSLTNTLLPLSPVAVLESNMAAAQTSSSESESSVETRTKKLARRKVS